MLQSSTLDDEVAAVDHRRESRRPAVLAVVELYAMICVQAVALMPFEAAGRARFWTAGCFQTTCEVVRTYRGPVAVDDDYGLFVVGHVHPFSAILDRSAAISRSLPFAACW